jgi:DNA-binding NtrC family response regulator
VTSQPKTGAGRILLADDEKSSRETLAEVLREEGYEVDAAADGLEAIAALGDKTYDVAITDLRMPGADGLAVLQRVREIAPQTLVLLITAYASVETAVEALRRGAHDYILKPLILEDVLGKIGRLFEHRQLAWESQMLRQEVGARFDFERMIIGQSAAMREIMALIRKVAPTRSNVLITGESGVGKEVIARALHHFSHLHDKLFLPVNSGAIPAELLESQLFGHVKGAFTGAVAPQEGLFQRARGGTIFLDEIGDLPLELQAKLLRVLQEGEFERLGSSHKRKVDVRLIAATHRDLEAMAADGRFRSDLYYRLNVFPIRIPTLRERREDIPRLVWYIIHRRQRALRRAITQVPAAVMERLQAFEWPGNVRELENVIERAMIRSTGDTLILHEGLAVGVTQAPPADRTTLDVVERRHIEHVLQQCNWRINGVGNAAETLGLHPNTLRFRMKKLVINRPARASQLGA